MIRIRRALFSAYTKEGLAPLAREVARWGGEILSSGGTATFLRAEGVPVTTVEDWTGSPPMFEGRVKTLHPKIHGGILFRRDDPNDRQQAEEHGIAPIDLVVVNLYPFGSALQRNAGDEETIELIDVGGPAMVRAAAKNHRFVAVVTRPEEYETVRAALAAGEGSLDSTFCRALAARAFAVTAEYDAAIAGYLSGSASRGPADLPLSWRVDAPEVKTLRYGENPSQRGGLYGEGRDFPFCLEQLHGKELSYNNYLDLGCGRDVMAEFGDTLAAVVIKHGIPSGVARGKDLADAYRRARDADALSAFGGVVVLNRAVDVATAELLNETFLEVVLAPDYEPAAIPLLETKKNRVLLRAPEGALRSRDPGPRGRFVGRGFLLQTPLPVGSGESGWVTKGSREPTDAERRDLLFAWKVLKHVRSNGILFARDGQTLGIGSGQTSRIDAVEAAIRKAGRSGIDLKGSVMVSDAFFPFRDCIDRAAEVGTVAVLEPGGSIRDAESIDAANEHGMAIVMNDARCFSHG